MAAAFGIVSVGHNRVAVDEIHTFAYATREGLAHLSD
jgi:hypothetical protein